MRVLWRRPHAFAAVPAQSSRGQASVVECHLPLNVTGQDEAAQVRAQPPTIPAGSGATSLSPLGVTQHSRR